MQTGITTVRVKTIDKAGNESNLMEKTIKIDKEGPKFETGIERSEVSDTGFTINVLATDSLSGNSKYNGKVTYKYIVTETGTTNKKEETNDTLTYK